MAIVFKLVHHVSSSASVGSAGIRVRVGDSSASTAASVNAEGGLLTIGASSLQAFATISNVKATFETFGTSAPQTSVTIAWMKSWENCGVLLQPKVRYGLR